MLALLVATGAAAAAESEGEPPAERQHELVRLVRQDCGMCHGLRLSGGLGPPLTPDALRERSGAELAATILHGRPGTPMPPWRSLLDATDAHWIARQLLAGFPTQ